MKFFYTPVSPNFCARRSDIMILNLSKSLAKPLVMAKLNIWQVQKTEQNCCCPHCRCHHLGHSVPPAHHHTIWCEAPSGNVAQACKQSHLLPEACSPNGTDNRQQRQRQTERPPPEPSDILKRFYALYDNKLRYYMIKVYKLYCYYNPLTDMGHIRPIAIS